MLNGICRHDLWKDQGYTLTRAQMEQDMRGIKALGANYVRLVHYPHDRHIVDLADELGLLVSEEPGFWGMDFRTMPWSRAELGLKLVEKLVRRDWNAPSVFAWLLGNESHFTVEYLRKGKEMCRRLDPLARPVSIANSMRKEDAKPICEQGGMDFFDDHPYTFDIAEFEKIAEFYGSGKPLLFTEWGGRELGQSEYIMPNTVDHAADMTQKGTLAGHAFWSWQDLPQFTPHRPGDARRHSRIRRGDRGPRAARVRLHGTGASFRGPAARGPTRERGAADNTAAPHALDAAQPVHSRGPDGARRQRTRHESLGGPRAAHARQAAAAVEAARHRSPGRTLRAAAEWRVGCAPSS